MIVKKIAQPERIVIYNILGMLFFFILLGIIAILFGNPQITYAHEAYVLPQYQFSRGLQTFSAHPLAPLLDTSHLQISLIITIGAALTYTLCIVWATTPYAALLDRYIKKAAVIGPLVIRIAIASSFYFSAQGNELLGPELSLLIFPYHAILRFLLYLTALMILFGVFTEIAAAIGIFLYICAIHFYGGYMMTYTNYLGELLVLFLFGSRFLSFDLLSFGKKLFFKGLEKYKDLEIPIVRILYGIALIYAGYTIKFLHQDLSIAVYNQYHLQNFFHASAAFIAAGAGLSEILIGLFILIGFAQRLTILLSVIFITLSLMYFQELLWPHAILFGISFSLFINSADQFTIDRYLIPWARGIIRKLLRFCGITPVGY